MDLLRSNDGGAEILESINTVCYMTTKTTVSTAASVTPPPLSKRLKPPSPPPTSSSSSSSSADLASTRSFGTPVNKSKPLYSLKRSGSDYVKRHHDPAKFEDEDGNRTTELSHLISDNNSPAKVAAELFKFCTKPFSNNRQEQLEQLHLFLMCGERASFITSDQYYFSAEVVATRDYLRKHGVPSHGLYKQISDDSMSYKKGNPSLYL